MHLAAIAVVFSACAAAVGAASMPPPFTRPLAVQQPELSGNDVYILQHMLSRFRTVDVTERFDSQTATALRQFQSSHGLAATGALDPASAAAVLRHLAGDGYHDDGAPASDYGLKYKVR